MALTARGCDMGPHTAKNAGWAIVEVEGAADVEVEMVFDPPWSPDLISEVARSQLGI